MNTTVYFNDFVDAFKRFGRENNFTRDGLRILFDYLEELENETGQEVKLDVVALCCEYNDDPMDDIIQNYNIDVEGMDDDEKREAVREYLQDNTCLVGETDTGFVYAAF